MNTKHRTPAFVVSLVLPCLAIPTLHAQFLGGDPPELLKLRAQFTERVHTELVPWHKRYIGELERIKRNFTNANAPAHEIDAVQKEIDLVEDRLNLDTKPLKLKETPKTARELAEFLEGTVWLVYAKDDKSREVILDTYQFRPNGVFRNSYHSSQTGSWKATAGDEAIVTHSLGAFNFKFDWKSGRPDITYSFIPDKNIGVKTVAVTD